MHYSVVSGSLVQCAFVISMMTGGVRTRRKNERAGSSSQAPVAPHSSSSHVASGFYAKYPRLVWVCFGRKTGTLVD